MEDVKLKPYTLDVALTGYFPIPRELLEMELPSTAILIYGALLDRATLSQKNQYADASDWVYVIFPVERRREVKNGASHIYLNLPMASCKGTNCTDQKTKRTVPAGRKVPSNNRRYQQKSSNYYQHGEDESL